MAALGKRRREGDQLIGRCPREEPQLQAHCAEGIAHPGVSQMESEGRQPAWDPHHMQGEWGGCQQPTSPTPGGKHLCCSRRLQSSPRTPAALSGGPGTVLPSGTSGQEPSLWKAKNWHKDCGSRTKRMKIVKFWNFSYFISGS